MASLESARTTVEPGAATSFRDASGTFRRRIVTIPLFLAAFVLAVTASPVVFAVTLLSDALARRRWAWTRAMLMLYLYLACEAAGIVASGWLWLTRGRDTARYLERNFRLQCWWANTLLRGGVRIYGLRVQVDGAEEAARGPVLLFVRHVSPIDNLLPAVLISAAHGLRLRWVINRSLLRDPCLDLVGHRLPNCFVSGGRADSEAEVRRVAQLARQLGPNEGVVIYPEGALFSPRRRDRAIANLQVSGDALLATRAASFQNVLPPRLGGALALLENAPSADVVFCAHSGLEGSTHYKGFAGGRLLGATIRVAFWRIPREKVPLVEGDRSRWLLDRWAEVDGWLADDQRHRQHESLCEGAPDAR